MPDKNKGAKSRTVSPLENVADTNNEVISPLSQPQYSAGGTPKALIPKVASTREDVNFNPKDYEYVNNANPDDPHLAEKNQRAQPASDMAIRTLKKWGAGVASGAVQSALTSADLEQSAKILTGTEKDFNTSFFGLFDSHDVQNWQKGVESRNKIYEEKEGKFNPSDPAWWANQIASTGYSFGIALESMAETAAISAVTGGLGLGGAAANDVRKFGILGKLIQATDNSGKLRRAATIYGLRSRYNESIGEAAQVFTETRDRLMKDGKISEEEATEIASKGASTTFIANMPLMALDALMFRTMAFNPISGSSEGLVEKALGKIGNKYLRTGAKFGIEMAGESAEEMWQYAAGQLGNTFADRLAGHKEGSFGNQFSKSIDNDELLNSAAGGAIGGVLMGGAFGAYHSLASSGQRRALASQHRTFIEDLGKMGTQLNTRIREAEQDGKTGIAMKLRQEMGQLKALSALHLDAVSDKDTAYSNYSDFLNNALNAATSSDTEKLKEAGLEGQEEFIKEHFPTFIADATKIKNLYDAGKEQFTRNEIIPIVRRQFVLEGLVDAKPKFLADVADTKQSIAQYGMLSPHGKQVMDANHEILAVSREIQRLTEEAQKPENKDKKDLILNLIEESKAKLDKTQQLVENLHKEDAYEEEDRINDGRIINSTLLNRPHIEAISDLLHLDNNIKLMQDDIAQWTNPEFKKKKRAEAVASRQTLAEVEDLAQDAESKGEEIPEAKEKAETLATNEATEQHVANVQDTEDKAKEAEVRKNEASNISSVISNITEDEETAPTASDVEGAELVFSLDDNSFAPAKISDNIPDDVAKQLRDFTLDYVGALQEDIKRVPSFEDYVRDFVKTQGRDLAERQYNGLVKGWELAGFTPVDYTKVYSQIFRDRTQIGQSLANLINTVSTEEESREAATEVIEKIEEGENIQGFDADNNIVVVPVTTVVVDPVNNVVVNSRLTHETRPKLAFISKLNNENATVLEDGTIEVNYTYKNDEVNRGTYINSLKLLDPDGFYEGTKLTAHIPDNVMETMIPTYDAFGARTEGMKFGDYVKLHSLTPDMQEYKDKVPLILRDETGEGVAFIHDIGWYHPRRFAETELGQMQEAIANTRAMREAALSGNNKFSITSKRNTTFEGLKIPANKPTIPISETNPESEVHVWFGTKNENNELEYKLVGKDGKTFDAKLVNTKELEIGKTYDIRRYGRDTEGNPTFIALPATHKPLTQEAVESVVNAIEVYVNRENPRIAPELRAKHDKIAKDVLDATGLDIKDVQGAEAYISQFIITLPVDKENVSMDGIMAQAGAKLNNGTWYCLFQSGNFMLGRVGEKMTPDPRFPLYSFSPNSPKTNSQFYNSFDMFKKVLKNKALPTFSQATSVSGLNKNKPVVHIVATGVKTVSPNYHSYLKDTLHTNIKSVNIGTKENPKYATNIQPIITFDLENKATQVNPVQEPIVNNDSNPVNTNDVPTDTTVETKAPQNPYTISDEEIAKLLAQAEEDTKWLNLNDSDFDVSASPVVLTEEQVGALTSSITRIAGLTPSQQYYMVDFMFNHIQSLIDFESKDAISKDEIKQSIRKAFNETILPIKQDSITRKETMTKLFESNPEKYPQMRRLIDGYTINIAKIEALEADFDKFVEEAEAKVKKYTGITDTKLESTPVLSKEEVLAEDEANQENSDDVDNDPMSVLGADESQGKGDWSDDALKEDGKNTSSYRLKRFFAGIRDMRIEANGQVVPKTAIFNVPMYVGMDTVWNTVASLLTEVPADYDMMIAKLNENKNAHPWLANLIDKLNGASNQVKTEFVSTMSKHALNMEFVMYGYDRESGRYMLKVHNTNANSIVKVIQRTWYNNFKNSKLINSTSGSYNLNPERAKYLLDIFNKWAQRSEYLSGSVTPVLLRFMPEIQKATAITPIRINITNDAFLTEYETRASRGEVAFKHAGKDYTIKKVGTTNEFEVILGSHSVEIKPEDIKSWLGEFGIVLSDNTVREIMEIGLRHTNGTLVKFPDMFEKSDKSYGIFGVLAHKLSEFIEKGDVSIEEEGNNPLSEGVIKSLAATESKHNLHAMSNTFRDGGKSISAITANKFITDRVRDLKTMPELIDQLGSLSFSKHSFWLDMLKNNSEFKGLFGITHMGLTAFKEMGKKVFSDNGITKLADPDHEQVKLGMFQDMKQGSFKGALRGIEFRVARMLSPTMSDKTVMTIMKTIVLDLRNKHFNDATALPKEELLNVLYEQLVKPELARMVNFHTNIKGTNIKSYDKGADMFLMLPMFNSLEIEPGLTLKAAIKAKPTEFTMGNIESRYMDKIHTMLTEQVEALVANKLKVWKNDGYITTDAKGETQMSFMDTKYMSKFQGDTNHRLKLAASDFVINSLIANANSFMLIAGDPALYYKEDGRKDENGKSRPMTDMEKAKDTFTNVGKRLALLAAPGTSLADSRNNQYLQVFLKDRKSTSSVIEYKERLLGKEGAADYRDSLEASDAQEYTTWREHLYILDKLGRMPDVISDITAAEIAEVRTMMAEGEKSKKDLTEREKKLLTKVFQPLKPVYSGQMYDAAQDVMRTVYIKTSSFPLVPQLTAGLEIDKLRVQIQALEAKHGKTVRASYQTGNKVGAMANAVDLWKTDGYANDITVDNLESSMLTLDRKNFRIQQDVPFKAGKRTSDTISLGTQTMKELFGDGVLNLDGFVYNGNPITGKGLHAKYNEHFINLINNKKMQLYNELGIDPITHQPYDAAKTAIKLQEILVDEARNRGYSKQAIDGLTVIPKKDSTGKIVDMEFALPLWSAPDSNRYESLLNAIVTNRVVKMKFPGNSYVVGSEEGFKAQETFDGIDQSKVAWTSAFDHTAGLKASYVDEKGVFHKAQVLVSSRFRKKDGSILDLLEKKGGEYVYVTKTDKGFMLKEDMISPEVMSLTSFRIPTSGHVSMAEVEIAGFLPYEMADLMIVPKDFTKQMGLDFDVDKQNTYQLWHEIGEDGKIKPIEATEEDNLKQKEKLLQNEIIKIHRSVLTNPSDDMQKKIVKTLSIDYAKEQAAMIDELINGETAEGAETFTAMSDEYQKIKMGLGASGKIGTGAYSLDVVGHSLFQQAALTGQELQLMEEDENGNYNPIEITIAGHTSNGKLGGLDTFDGSRSISEVLAERQNIAVDNEKEQVMGRVNLNDMTMDADKVLCMLGFDKDFDGNSISFLLLSQPIVREYVEMMRNAKANIAGFDPDREQKVIDALQAKYPYDKEDEGKTIRELEEQYFITGGFLENLTDPDGTTQRVALELFLKLKSLGESLREVQTSINTDSRGLGKSTFDVIEKENKLSALADNRIVKNADKLVGDYVEVPDSIKEKESLLKSGYVELGNYMIKPTTMTGAFNVTAVAAGVNLWSQHFPYGTVGVQRLFDEMLSVMGKEDAKASKKVDLKQRIFRELKKYMFSSVRLGLHTGRANEERQRLMIDAEDNQSLASYINDLRQLKDNRNVNEHIKTNKLIGKFELDVNTNGQASTIKFNNSARENFDEEYMHNAFIELMEKEIPLPDLNGKPYNTRMLAQDLVSYSFLQGGVQQAVEFVKYVPVEYLNQVGFSEFLRTRDFNDPSVLGVNPKRDKNNMHLVSRATMQIVQHLPEMMPKMDAKSLKAKTINRNSDNVGELTTFQLKDESNPPVFLSIYNELIPKGEKKFQLYYFDGTKYNIIPVLGVSNMNEYDATTYKEKGFYESLFNGKTPRAEVPIVPTELTNNDSKPPQELPNTFGILNGNVKATMEQIAVTDSPIGKMATALLPFIDEGVTMTVGNVRESYNMVAEGVYSGTAHAIMIEESFLKKANSEDLAGLITHEVVHSLLNRYISKFVDPTTNKFRSDAPIAMHKLYALFNEALAIVGKDKVDTLRDKFKSNAALSQSEVDQYYPLINIYEFVTGLTTSYAFQKEMGKHKFKATELTFYDKFKQLAIEILQKLGVVFDAESITVQGINTIFDILQEKQAEIDAFLESQGVVEFSLSPKILGNDNDFLNQIDSIVSGVTNDVLADDAELPSIPSVNHNNC